MSKYAEKKRLNILHNRKSKEKQYKLTKMMSCLPYRSIYVAYLELLNFHDNHTIANILGIVDYSKCLYAQGKGWK